MAGASALLLLYTAVLSVLALYGAHRLWLLWVYWRRRPPPQAVAPVDWPVVTVQLPLYNERLVAERLIRAVSLLDYPADRLQIHVLDDSTDETAVICDQVTAELREAGVDIRVLRRVGREGFKAGALREGAKHARGDIFAIFDADFVPPRDFLKRTIPHLHGEVGMVQVRWGHLNLDESWLTLAQGALLDGHFVIEHTARYSGGRWFNFNGTAGVWRRQAIEDGGGWQDDTLTEDLDLSYRVQLAGWRFVYLDDVVAPAELPSSIAAFRSQQHRWAKGAAQTARKMLGAIWRARVPLGTKVEATVHLTANTGYPFVLALSLLMPWAAWARTAGAPSLVVLDLLLFVAASVSVFLFYGVAVWRAGAGVPGRVARVPVALALGLGMAASQTRAVVQGLIGPIGEFVRTPKAGSGGSGSYTVASALPMPELFLAVYMTISVVWAMSQQLYPSVPFLALFAFGYAIVGASVIGDRLRASARAIPR